MIRGAPQVSGYGIETRPGRLAPFKNKKIMNGMKSELQIVAGPCSAETREQMMCTATALHASGIRTLRAGLWKPRSRCGAFEGVGERGLPWMQEIQQALGMAVFTEVALPTHVESVLKAGLDGVWIGARTTVNPFMMHELAEALRGTDIPVWVKNPVSPDLDLWVGAIERLLHVGIKQVSAIHRGFTLVDNTPYRNTPLWEFVGEIHSYFPELSVFCDPSHIAGNRSLLFELCKTALSYGADGFFIESHCCPEKALSDAEQQLTPDDLSELLHALQIS